MRLLFIATLIFCFSVEAQSLRPQIFPDFSRIEDRASSNKIDLTDKSIKGSPFYFDDFRSGEVFVNTSSKGKAMLRYNGLSDEVQFVKNDNTYEVIKKDNLEAIVDNVVFKVYKYEGKNQYFVKFNSGQNSLLLKPEKEYVDAVKAKSNYSKDTPAKFTNNYRYFIIKDGELQPVKLKKKEILTVLADKKSEIEDFASSNKLSFKKEKDLTKIIDYYNTL